ncbi:MAG: aryl-sulfate sulfotransferase [Flavonifractor plautii]
MDFYHADGRLLRRRGPHPVPLTGSSFWQAGEDDWLHLNSVQHRQAGDGILASAPGRPPPLCRYPASWQHTTTLTALIGDPAFWAGTEYESLSYQPQGDFVPQYGQHDVELVEDDGLPEGQYLLRMCDSNAVGSEHPGRLRA